MQRRICTGELCTVGLFLQTFHFLVFELSPLINTYIGRGVDLRAFHVNLDYVSVAAPAVYNTS